VTTNPASSCSSHCKSLLEDFKAEYDLVVFNTAPILATDDTPTLAPHFDGT
jgi:Mrp family chromosome partitioning ATPase